MAATRIPILRNSAYTPNGLRSYLYALNKFNATPIKSTLLSRGANKKLMMRATDGTQHEVTTENQQQDAFFTSEVKIGTPPQTFQLVFDSGSADTWVWSTDLPASITSSGKKIGNAVFDPKKSSTFKKIPGSTWKIQYGDQSTASGTVGTDTLVLGDISVEEQAIELADNLSASFSKSFGSGLLGLSFGTINTVKPKPVLTPVENMIQQKDVAADQELWTCYLGSVKDVDDPEKGESFFTFGAVDQAVIQASGQEVHYAPVDSTEGFWMFDSTTASINGKTFNMSGNKAIADTGTTLCMVSDELCEAIYGQIKGAKLDQQQSGYIFPASIPVDELPEVTLDIGGKQFAIEKEHLAFAPVDESGTMLYGGVQPRGDLPFDIYGDTLLMCLYASIFDFGNKQFGCVQRADPTPSGGQTTGKTAAAGQKMTAGQKFKKLAQKVGGKT